MNARLHPLLQQAYHELKSGRLDVAETRCRQVIAEQPADPAALALLARVLHQGGKIDAAWAAASAAVAQGPEFIPALLEVAAIASRRGDEAAAGAALTRLVALDPGALPFRVDLIQTLLRQGRVDAARQQVAELDQRFPGFPARPLLAAQCALAAGQPREVLAILDGAPGLDHPHVDLVRAQAHEDLRDYLAAAQSFGRCLNRDPAPASVWAGYARTLALAGASTRQVLSARAEVLARDRDNPTAWLRYGEALRDDEQFPEAHRAFARALELDPELLLARWCAFQYPRHRYSRDEAERNQFLQQWRDGFAAFEQMDMSIPGRAAQVAQLTRAPTNFFLHYLAGNFLDEQRRVSAFLRRLADRDPAPAPKRRVPRSGRRRIGIASSFLRSHTVSRLFLPLFERLPRSDFEFIGFQLSRADDAVTARWRALCGAFDLGEGSPEGWSRAVAAADLDVLVLLDVGMHPTSQFLVAQRLAPVQCVLWGHPVTTGSAEADAFLSSALMEPADGDAHYVEPLLRLPNLGCVFEPPTTAPDPAFAASVRDRPGRIHFLVAQSAFKLTPAFDRALARIAAAVPEAVFSLTPACNAASCAGLEQRLLDACRRIGIDGRGRFRLHAHLGLPQFLALAADADLNLDTFDWSGGNTTLEISAFDTPTLTLPGALMRGRHSLAVNRLLELPELVAATEDDYVERAVALAADRERRLALRARIAERKHRLYLDATVVDAMADLLRTIEERR